MNIAKFLLALQCLHGCQLALRLPSYFLVFRAWLTAAPRCTFLARQHASRVQVRALTLHRCKIEL